MSETTSILILILLTVVLAIYTLLGMMLCTKVDEKWLPKWLPWLKENKFRVLLVFPFGWLAVIAILIVGPMCLLGYLMNDIKLVKDIDYNGRFFAFMGWIAPTAIYIVIYLIRKSKSEKK